MAELATQDSNQLDPQEQQQIVDTITRYFQQTTGSEQEANQYIAGLTNLLNTNPAAKLVHINGTVFLVLVKDKGVVEIHTMAVDGDSNRLAKNFVELSRYLQAIGVKRAYTYTDDPKFAVVARRTRLPYSTSETQGEDGKTYTVYTQEFA